MQIDLRSYVAQKVGKWFENPDRFQANRFILSDAGDGVALAGPLRVRVSLEGENHTAFFERSTAGFLSGTGAAAASLASVVVPLPPVAHKHVVYSYVLDIPPLQAWSYLVRGDELAGILGTNRGHNVVIQVAGYEVCAEPTTDRHECKCGCQPSRCRCRTGCGCGAGGGCQGGCGHGGHGDLPCDYAVASLPDTGRFFPASCEPCPPDACISTPPPPGPAGLLVSAARGGCERPRYFNGMLVTREDMEAEQRFFRLKMKLHNRAAGAGVVWGLCVGLDGNDVLVSPGYAVDCCGDDLTVTAPYRVDGPSLVRDPAARAVLAQPGSHRLHLLLEYLECPADPRPVHGDSCAPSATACEMSRVRETVRLRLVPPRDLDARGPIRSFLDAFTPPASFVPRPDPRPAAPALPDPEVPFAFHVAIPQQLSATLKPSVTVDVTGNLKVHFLPNTTTYPLPQITLNPAGTWALSGTVVELLVAPDGSQQQRTVAQLGPGPISWTAPYPAVGGAVGYQATWKATRPDGVFEEAVTTLVLAILDQGPNERRLLMSIPITRPRVGQGPVHLPCLEGPCGQGEGTFLFPIAPPFLHEDPRHPGKAADPRVLVLAALYALLSLQEANGVQTGGRSLLFKAAARLLFDREADVPQLLDELRKLFAAWCKVSLYPGPACEGEPHGVVVGCAVVSGGQIQHVDPWGGRRYVVHYPLLAHWGSAFGIVPPDVLAQRFFSLVCCLAGLPGIVRPGDPLPGNGTAVPVGSALLNVTSAGLSMGNVTVSGEVHVTAVEFVARLLAALQRPASTGQTRRVLYVLDQSAGISLLVPEEDPPVAGAPGRLGRTVERLASARGDDVAPPPLLRSFSRELSVELVRSVPLSAPEPDSVLMRLRAAGITTVGALLELEPEALHSEVLSGANSVELDALVERAEKTAGDVTHAVAASLKARRRFGLASRDDLKDEAKRKGFVDDVVKRLSESGLSAEAIEAALVRLSSR